MVGPIFDLLDHEPEREREREFKREEEEEEKAERFFYFLGGINIVYFLELNM